MCLNTHTDRALETTRGGKCSQKKQPATQLCQAWPVIRSATGRSLHSGPVRQTQEPPPPTPPLHTRVMGVIRGRSAREEDGESGRQIQSGLGIRGLRQMNKGKRVEAGQREKNGPGRNSWNHKRLVKWGGSENVEGGWMWPSCRVAAKPPHL